MSIGLLVGFVVAYPMNWWLVAHRLKHGMMTVRPTAALAGAHAHGAHAAMGLAAHAAPAAPAMGGGPSAMSAMTMGSAQATRPPLPIMTLFSFLALAAGVALGLLAARA
jgi:hypothetical protein